MSAIDELGLEPVPVSVPISATFAEAARRLTDSGLSAIAVLDDDGRVAGLFGEDELLRGLFPGYLAELHHTSFTQDDLEGLVSRLAEIASAPVAGCSGGSYWGPTVQLPSRHARILR